MSGSYELNEKHSKQSLVYHGRRQPLIIVKLWPGKSEQQKTRLAEFITQAVTDALHYAQAITYS
jgi:hypothetical protein